MKGSYFLSLVFLVRVVDVADYRSLKISGLGHWPQNFDPMINGDMRNLEIILRQSQQGV